MFVSERAQRIEVAVVTVGLVLCGLVVGSWIIRAATDAFALWLIGGAP